MSDVQEIVQQIHDSQSQAVLAVAGAGNQSIAWLLGVAGASRTLLEVLVPYGRLSMIDFLGHEPDQYVSSDTAREMAGAAYRRAVALREDTPPEETRPVVGIACTATIATDRQKRGEHRAYVAAWDQAGSTSRTPPATPFHVSNFNQDRVEGHSTGDKPRRRSDNPEQRANRMTRPCTHFIPSAIL